MSTPRPAPSHASHPAPAWVAVADLVAKALLLLAVSRVAIDPGWGNLEGKAPVVRAVTYPMLALLVPVLHTLRVLRSGGRATDDVGRDRPYPWGADLLVTVPAFSDLLGNRLDLYDRVVWFDDAIHLANTAALSAGVLVLTGAAAAPLLRRLEVAVAAGLTLSLVWELWEYYAFVTRSAESSTAYADTLGDLALGWVGAVLAAGLVRAPDGTSGPAAHRWQRETVEA
jgi:hypothetical protein